MALHALVKLLLEKRRSILREKTESWPWIAEYKGKSLPRKVANRYLFYCFLDYQMVSGTAPRNTDRFVDEVLGNPDDLWATVARIPQEKWDARFSEYRLHRLRQAHRKVRLVASLVVGEFGSDARNVWQSNNPAKTWEVLHKQLGMGPELSRMAVLGLLECGVLSGDGDVKADVHVRRVLGRALHGRVYDVNETDAVHTDLARIMPRKRWKLDLPMYVIGRAHCKEKRPDCSSCSLASACKYAKNA